MFLDDEELEGVRSVEVRMGHGEPDRVLIELLPERVSVEDVGRPVTMIPALEVRFDGQD